MFAPQARYVSTGCAENPGLALPFKTIFNELIFIFKGFGELFGAWEFCLSLWSQWEVV